MERRTTSAFLRIESITGKNLHQQEKTLSYDPLNPEHEATGRVFWVDSKDM
jgi:hypothetical protein